MVDELELLKKDWKKQEASLPKVKAVEIYPMLLKKSSSIVKWIFIISVIEFAFWLLLAFIPDLSELEGITDTAMLNAFNTVMLVVQFTGLAFFVSLFYYHYRKIETTDSSSNLMKNILNTRKSVKYYIWFNLALLAIGLIGAFAILLAYDDTFLADKSVIAIILLMVFVIAISLCVVWLFYRIVYGILAKRLKTNYLELKRIED